MVSKLRKGGVKVNMGPKLNDMLVVGGNVAESMRVEYGDLECCIEVVADVNEAMDHIYRCGGRGAAPVLRCGVGWAAGTRRARHAADQR